MSTLEARTRAQVRYNSKNTTVVQVRLNIRTDADILGKLNEVKSKQGYIKALIRADMERGNE